MSEATGPGDLEAGVLSAEAEPSVTTIEHRGIEHVPQDSRWGSPASLFNLFYLLTGLASLQGPRAGTTTFCEPARNSWLPNVSAVRPGPSQS